MEGELTTKSQRHQGETLGEHPCTLATTVLNIAAYPGNESPDLAFN